MGSVKIASGDIVTWRYGKGVDGKWGVDPVPRVHGNIYSAEHGMEALDERGYLKGELSGRS
jgi:hypothetical protein